MFYSNFNGTDTFELNCNFPPLTPDPATAISNSSQPQRKISNTSQNSRTRIQTSIQQIKQNQRNIVIFLIFLIVSSDLLTRLLKSADKSSSE